MDEQKDAIKKLFELRRAQMRSAEGGAPREAAEAIDRLGGEVLGILDGVEFKTVPHIECDGKGCDGCGYLGYVRDTDDQ